MRNVIATPAICPPRSCIIVHVFEVDVWFRSKWNRSLSQPECGVKVSREEFSIHFDEVKARETAGPNCDSSTFMKTHLLLSKIFELVHQQIPLSWALRVCASNSMSESNRSSKSSASGTNSGVLAWHPCVCTGSSMWIRTDYSCDHDPTGRKAYIPLPE
jgi:hypothetical protein